MLIPRALHYIWLGTRPMHPLMEEWQKKWGVLHPGWDVRVWREDPELPPHMLASCGEILECRHPSFLAACPTYAKRSDVWRYDLLEQLGGVYLDTDFEPVRCIEPLLEECSAFAGRCRTRYGWSDENPAGLVRTEVGCSIVGAAPHHPWLRDLVEHVPEQDPVEQLSLAFPYITEISERHPEIRLFDPDVFYPVTWDHYAIGGKQSLRSARKINETLPAETYAVHRWSSNWFSGGLSPIGSATRVEDPRGSATQEMAQTRTQ